MGKQPLVWTAVVLASFGVSCGPPPEPHAASAPLCTSLEHAQHAGYADGAAGHASQASWFSTSCAPHHRDALAAGYADAYARGFAELQARMAHQAEAAHHAQAQAAEAARQAEAAHLLRLCTDASAAYQGGYNAGYRREMMSADWADHHCQPAHRASTKEKYIAGYQAGVAAAPPPPQPPPVTPVIVVAPQQRRSAAVLGDQETCTFSSDCADGQSCRHASKLGRSVCMGNGLRGDYCWFDSDCLSDRCQLRSGGAKTCK